MNRERDIFVHHEVNVVICSESEKFRGRLQIQPSMWRDVGIFGYIETMNGARTYLKDDEMAQRLIEFNTPYVLVTAEQIQECDELQLIEIRGCIPMSSLESPGEMACALYNVERGAA